MNCSDCGIAPWESCICTPDGAALADHETGLPETDEWARRMAITHAVCAKADEILHGDDTVAYRDDHERLSRLTAATGDVASDLVHNSGLDLTAALVRVGSEVQCWLEALSREAAR